MFVDRTCDYCGATFAASSPRARFCSDRHRKAAHRLRSSETMEADPQEIAGAPGRARAGLDDWINEEGFTAPAALVEAARSLADEVDRSPRNSPLWGRYIDLLRQLTEAVEPVVDSAWTDFRAEFATREIAEEYRAERYSQATTDEERRRWTRLVPIGCVEGSHHWTAGRCADCGSLFGLEAVT
jgi:hypothetical protein